MTEEHKQAVIGDFRAMAREHEWWKDTLWRIRRSDSNEPVMRERFRLFSIIGQNKHQWQLLIVSAAYVVLRQPEIIKEERGSDLYIVASTLASAARYELLPGFEELASAVSISPLSTLVKPAARLAYLLRGDDSISAASVGCMSFCAYLYPDDSPDFLRCVRKCGVHQN